MQYVSKRRVAFTVGFGACLWLLCAVSTLAQNIDLGEAARQERARKMNQPRRAIRVYTEDDLGRREILDRWDRERSKAARENEKLATPAVEQASEVPGAIQKPAEIPLGDIARHYRLLKQIRQRQELGQAPPLVGAPPLAAPVFSRAAPAAPPPASHVRETAPAIIQRKAKTSYRIEFKKRAPRGAESRRGESDKARFTRSELQASWASPPEESARLLTIRVQQGDSLWKLARRYLGRGTRWPELAKENPEITNPARIHVGAWIRLPATVHSAAFAKERRVHQGDNLWKLAKAEFGTGLAWGCIAQANPHILLPDLIYPGQRLTIPAGCNELP